MRLKEFDYELPKELIAQKAKKPRDHSRLLVLDKKSGNIQHKHFYDLPDFLEKGDVLVLNDSKVFPARLKGMKKDTGGKAEVFLLRNIKGNEWQCLIGGKIKECQKISFEKKLEAVVLKNNSDGTWEVGFNMKGKKFMDVIEKIGEMPLPPYIKVKSKVESRKSKVDYQTVYADDKKIGSVAAPTAGLHFTPALIKKLKAKGIKFEYVTLHVGLGTFASVKTENIKEHKMHSEWIEIKKKTLHNILKAKRNGHRIITVGTTSTRTIETAFGRGMQSGWTDIFIYPGYKFKIVDAIITNFHLPKSTLLMLVSAFAGKTKIKKAYREAIARKYRFFSYGDAMLIN